MDKALTTFQVPFAMPEISDDAMEAFDRFTEDMVKVIQEAQAQGVPDSLIMNQFALTVQLFKNRTEH